MKRYLIITLVSFIICSCSNQVKENKSRNKEHSFDLVSYLENNDSVSCWVTQGYNYFDLETKNFQFGDLLYNGVCIVTEDSIYSFFYPCEYFGSESYEVINGKIHLERNEYDKKFLIIKDSLFVENIEGYNLMTSKKYLTVSTYLKRTFSSKEFLYLIHNQKLENCDSSKIFIETANNWEHQENLIGPLDSYFSR